MLGYFKIQRCLFLDDRRAVKSSGLKGLNYSMKKPQRFLAFVIMSHISCEDTLLTMYLYLLYKTKIWVRGTKKD